MNDSDRALPLIAAAERHVEFALARMHAQLLVVDRHWCVLSLDPELAAMFGQEPHALRDHVLWKCVPQLAGSAFFVGLHEAVESGTPQRFAAQIAGRAFDVAVYPSFEGATVLLIQGEAPRSQVQLHAMQDSLAHELVGLRRLHELSTQTARNSEDLERLLGEILAAAMDFVGHELGEIHVLNPLTGEFTPRVQRARDSELAASFARLRDEQRAAICAPLVRDSHVIVEDVAKSVVFGAGTAALINAGVRSVQALPLLTRGARAIGKLITFGRHPQSPSEHQLRLVDLAARQIADLSEHAENEATAATRRNRLHVTRLAELHESQQLLERLNRSVTEMCNTTAEFVVADLDIALTSLDWALITHDDDSARRNRRRARRALQRCERLRPRLRLSEEDERRVQARMSLLRSRLEALGEWLDPSD